MWLSCGVLVDTNIISACPDCLFGSEISSQYHVISTCSGICKIYEEHLRQLNPHSPSITYDISQLFKFVDDLFDLSCLV